MKRDKIQAQFPMVLKVPIFLSFKPNADENKQYSRFKQCYISFLLKQKINHLYVYETSH